MYNKRQVAKLGIGVIFKCNETCGRFGFRFRFKFGCLFGLRFGIRLEIDFRGGAWYRQGLDSKQLTSISRRLLLEYPEVFHSRRQVLWTHGHPLVSLEAKLLRSASYPYTIKEIV